VVVAGGGTVVGADGVAGTGVAAGGVLDGAGVCAMAPEANIADISSAASGKAIDFMIAVSK
jgi:hypothetical protein